MVHLFVSARFCMENCGLESPVELIERASNLFQFCLGKLIFNDALEQSLKWFLASLSVRRPNNSSTISMRTAVQSRMRDAKCHKGPTGICARFAGTRNYFQALSIKDGLTW